jgi:hypothetical protein
MVIVSLVVLTARAEDLAEADHVGAVDDDVVFAAARRPLPFAPLKVTVAPVEAGAAG